ncbi:MAG: hypothetical protein R6W82_10520 [bacterium]
MRVINRSAVVVRPKDPYLEWASGTDEKAKETAHWMRDRAAVYLLPEDPTGREETPPLEGFYARIFEHELEAWHLDRSTWPGPRTLEMFHEWFEVVRESIVVDLADGPVSVEEL